MSSGQVIEDEIIAKGLTAPRVTKDQIDALLDKLALRFHQIGTSTFCHAFLVGESGEFYLASGHSACVSLANYNEELGQRIAREKAIKAAADKLWEMEGYALWSRLNPL